MDIWIVVAILNNGTIKLYGDRKGEPYSTEGKARKAADRIREDFFWKLSSCAPLALADHPFPQSTTISPEVSCG